LRKCSTENKNAKEECKSPEEIDAAIHKTTFGIFYKKRYFDTQDFGANPIKYYIKTLYYPILEEIAQYYVYGLKRNTARVNNNWFGFGAG
jgi:hypothetical protein